MARKPTTVVCRTETMSRFYVGPRSEFFTPFAFTARPYYKQLITLPTRAEALVAFERWLRGDPQYADVDPEKRLKILNNLKKMAGKTLTCVCFPFPCHADVLAKMANEKVSVTNT